MMAYEIVAKDVPTFYFIGVTTGQSSIMKLFPRWMKELGRPEVVIERVDLKIHDDAEAYRRAVAQIKHDPLSLGALVTPHKLDLFQATSNMFDAYGRNALRCGELSSISKRGGKLIGHAKDPITCGLCLDALLGKDYFSTAGHKSSPKCYT